MFGVMDSVRSLILMYDNMDRILPTREAYLNFESRVFIGTQSHKQGRLLK